MYLASTDGTAVAQPVATEASATVSWGSAEFVAAEEMRRSRGHWWDPTSKKLAVTRVDVNDVSLWHIAAPNDPAREPRAVRYPAAGTSNADVQLYVFDTENSSRLDVVWNRSTHPYLVDVTWDDTHP